MGVMVPLPLMNLSSSSALRLEASVVANVAPSWRVQAIRRLRPAC